MSFSVADLTPEETERHLWIVDSIQGTVKKIAKHGFRGDWLLLSRLYKHLANGVGKDHPHYESILEQRATARTQVLQGWPLKADQPDTFNGVESVYAATCALEDAMEDANENGNPDKINAAKKSYAEICRFISEYRISSPLFGKPPKSPSDWAEIAYNNDPEWQSCLCVARAYKDQREWQQALYWGDKLLSHLGEEKDPQTVKDICDEAYFFFAKQMRQPGLAVTTILMGIPKNPTVAQIYYKGHFQETSDSIETIREHLTTKAAKESKNHLHWIVLGKFEESLNNSEAALANYQRARDADPNSHVPLVFYSGALGKTSPTDAAGLLYSYKAQHGNCTDGLEHFLLDAWKKEADTLFAQGDDASVERGMGIAFAVATLRRCLNQIPVMPGTPASSKFVPT